MRVHFISKGNEEDYVMLLCDSLRFYNINKRTKNIIEDIIENDDKDEILQKHRITKDDYIKIKALLNTKEVPLVTAERPDGLYKLVLNVTNICNLNCRYCYASGGNYNSFEGLMSINVAKKIIDVFYQKYRMIKQIQFFGGEPLLNVPIIKFVCEYIEEKFKNHEIDLMPQFTTVTNGTIYNENFIELLNRYHIAVTVSIDGPQVVHDKMRVYNDGNGTFDKILENILMMKKNSQQPIAVECTYNFAHVEHSISILDVVKYVKDTLKIDSIHLTPVSASKDAPYRLADRTAFVNSVHEIFMENMNNSKKYSYSLVERIIELFQKKQSSKYFCEAGISTISVSHMGDVYPCFMFTGISKFKMGNIFDDDLFTSDTYNKIVLSVKSFSKFNFEKCKDCFNNRVCYGCLGVNYFNTGNIHKLSDEDCDMQRQLTEHILVELSNMSR